MGGREGVGMDSESLGLFCDGDQPCRSGQEVLSVHNPPMIPFPQGGLWCRMYLVCHWIFRGNTRGWYWGNAGVAVAWSAL